MERFNIKKLNFEKIDGIIPAIIQDAKTKSVLMLGFMNKEALKRTIKRKRVTFWSRSKKRLWEKGEISGNKLDVVSIKTDCDKDALLIKVKPRGPVCHTGKYSCFGTEKTVGLGFLNELYDLILERKRELPKNSYTTSLFKKGLRKILEKVKEEFNEVIFSVKKESKKRIIEETADLLYHLLILLVEKKISLEEIVEVLKRRRWKKKLE